jgi:hypothetical protein
MISLQHSNSPGTRHGSDRDSSAKATGAGRELGVQTQPRIVIGPRRLSDGPPTEVMVPWVRGSRGGRGTGDR